MANILVLYGAENGSADGLQTGVMRDTRVFDIATSYASTDLQVLPEAARTGGYGLRISGEYAHVGWARRNDIIRPVVVMSFWFRIAANPSAVREIASWNLQNALDPPTLRYDPATGTLSASVCGVSLESTSTVTVGTWHHIDLRYDVTDLVHRFAWRIDGVEQPGAANEQFYAQFNILYFGQRFIYTPDGAVDYDDIVVSGDLDDYPLGSHTVVGLRVDPTATLTLTGNPANFATFAGAAPALSAWDRTTARDGITELPPTLGADQDGWCQVGDSATDHVDIPLTRYQLGLGESVAAARLLACVWAQSSAPAAIGLRSFDGTTERILHPESDVTRANNTTDPAWVCKPIDTADVATQAQLDALTIRAGYSTTATANPTGLHAVYVELAIKTVAAKPVEDDLVAGCVKFLTDQGDVKAILGRYGATNVPWLFQHTLWLNVEGTSSTAAVISRTGGWAAPNEHNTMEFPRLGLEIYVDPRRDGYRNVTDPGEAQRRIEATFEVLDRHLHITADADQFWGDVRVIGSTRIAEPNIYPVPNGDGLLRLVAFYAVVDAGLRE